MEDRFEFVSRQSVFSGVKLNVGTPYECDDLLETIVLRDKQTGVMYLWGLGVGLTPLLDKDGKPMTTFKVNI